MVLCGLIVRENIYFPLIKHFLKLAINYLLVISYFNLDNMCFRQLIAIPVVSESIPFMENLFLYYYERKWLLKAIKQDMQKTRIF